MSIAEKFRQFQVPGYGVCGGADRSCVYAEMDPMDKLFYKHDNDLYAAHQLQIPEVRAIAERQADEDLEKGLRELSDKDMEKIPAWQWQQPFFKRAYAKLYRKMAIEVFK